ncbi:MAG: tetratricopeptide repeat protein [Gemmatimonadales bacterium]
MFASRLKQLIGELRRRKVFRVAAVYAAVAFVIVEGADLVFPALLLPSWAYTLLVVFAILGFPIALVLAWAFEVTPEGVRRAEPAAAEAAASRSGEAGGPVADRQAGKSIAVLPFENMSGDPEDEYFSDGITEEIINSLCQLEQIKVIARTSSFAFKGKHTDVREIGKALSVSHVLEGSVRRAGDRVRVTAQLIQVSDGVHLWSSNFDRVLEDVFAIQDEVSLAIADNLRLHLVGTDKARLTERRTDDFDAYNSYLLGRYFIEKMRHSDILLGIKHLKDAIASDPEYAQAVAAISNAYFILGFFSYQAPGEAFQQAKEYALRALELDDGLAEAHSALGLVRTYYEWDWRKAEAEFKRALLLNPNSASVHQWYVYCLVATCDLDKAVAEAKRALELNPLSNQSMGVLCWCLVRAGRHQEAQEHLRRALEYETITHIFYWLLGQIEMKEGRFEQGIPQLERALQHAPDDPMVVSALGWAYAMSGRTKAVQQMLEKLDDLSQNRYVDRYLYAKIYAGLGQTDRAFEYLREAVSHREMGVTTMLGDETLENLRSDDRFAQILERVGLHDIPLSSIDVGA